MFFIKLVKHTTKQKKTEDHPFRIQQTNDDYIEI